MFTLEGLCLESILCKISNDQFHSLSRALLVEKDKRVDVFCSTFFKRWTTLFTKENTENTDNTESSEGLVETTKSTTTIIKPNSRCSVSKKCIKEYSNYCNALYHNYIEFKMVFLTPLGIEHHISIQFYFLKNLLDFDKVIHISHTLRTDEDDFVTQISKNLSTKEDIIELMKSDELNKTISQSIRFINPVDIHDFIKDMVNSSTFI